ncbi:MULTISPECIES: universal stress protein [Micrococcaceae]|uniref:universal stress protein n=1 Tax=Micrococcaceae TaxID=1268 RepID=UPI00027DFDE1|nr:MULTISPECIES: universal stress protein [Micrococcaceae]AFR29877.1 putative universal stress family domain protein [Arthrobacter sp. Rue61a]MBP2265053.1 nucleotide-binding universal stress UspA family protein [Pseudarthrobacter sp. PvP004]
MTEIPAPRPEASGSMSGPILVGVMPGQQPVVVEQAAHVAARARLPLVCAYSDVTVYPVDGTTGGQAAPIDPDGVAGAQGIPDSLTGTIAEQLAGQDIGWSIVPLAGEPARALARLAAEIGASMIVVGTREHKLTAALKELTSGSVARHLFHRQEVPVLVVPVNPRVPDDDDDD